jgi:hypothetical protein
MYVVKIIHTEGQTWDEVKQRETYVQYVGVGRNLRSAKKAMEAAKVAQRRDSRIKAKRFPYGGVPVLDELYVTHNGKEVLFR